MEFQRPKINKFSEDIFNSTVVVENFLLQKVIKVLKKVVVGERSGEYGG